MRCTLLALAMLFMCNVVHADSQVVDANLFFSNGSQSESITTSFNWDGTAMSGTQFSSSGPLSGFAFAQLLTTPTFSGFEWADPGGDTFELYFALIDPGAGQHDILNAVLSSANGPWAPSGEISLSGPPIFDGPVASTPEPGTWLLLATGMLGLIALLRSRRPRIG